MWFEIRLLAGLAHFSLSTFFVHQSSGLCSNIRNGRCSRFITVFQDFVYAAFPLAISPGRRFDTVPRITRAESSATVDSFREVVANLVHPICSEVLH